MLTPNTPKIIIPHSKNCQILKISFKIKTPAITVTTVIILEKEDDCTAGIFEVEKLYKRKAKTEEITAK